MEGQEITNLVLNARMNHWPLHLGVTTDAEKIEHLATKLDEAATELARLEKVDDENASLIEERDLYASEAEDLRATLKDIQDLTTRHVQNKS